MQLREIRKLSEKVLMLNLICKMQIIVVRKHYFSILNIST